MSESGLSPAIPWTDRLLLSVLFVSVTVVATYVAIVSVGGRMLPEALNELIYVVLGTAIVCLTLKHMADMIVRRIDRMDHRQDRRLAAIHSALVQHGATLVEVTGEIPRIELPQRPSSPGPRDEELNGYAMGYADGLARKPISGKVLPFDQRSNQGS